MTGEHKEDVSDTANKGLEQLGKEIDLRFEISIRAESLEQAAFQLGENETAILLSVIADEQHKKAKHLRTILDNLQLQPSSPNKVEVDKF